MSGLVLPISAVSLGCSLFLFYRVNGTLDPRRLSASLWALYYGLLVSSFVGSLLIYYRIDSNLELSRMLHTDERLWGWLAVQWAMVALPLGMWLTNKVFRYSSPGHSYGSYCASHLSEHQYMGLLPWRAYLALFSLICIAAVVYTHFVIGRIPLIDTFMCDPEEMMRLRIHVEYNFNGNTYFRNIFGVFFTPIMSLIAFSYWRLSRSRWDLLWFLSMLLASVLIIAYEYSKSGFVVYALCYFSLLVLLRVRFSFAQLLGVGALCFMALLGMYMLLYADNTVEGILGASGGGGIWSRLFVDQIAGTFLSFDYFPKEHDFLGFSTMSSHFGGDLPRSARWIMEQYRPEGVAAGTAGVYNSLFVAEAWANFGLVGVLLSPFVVGGVMQSCHILLTRGAKTPLKVALYAYLVIYFPVTGGFNDFVWNTSLGLLLFLLVVPYLALRYAYRLGWLAKGYGA